MREGFFKSVKNFFGKSTTPPKANKESQKPTPPRIVNFGGNDQSGMKKQTNDEQSDTRYNNVEAKQTWKQLGIKKDEIVQGQTAILVDYKFVRCKLSDGKYDDVTFILSDFQIFIKTKYSLVHFPLGKVQKLHKYINKENNFKLMICLKDGRVFKFIINTETMWKKIYDFIEKFAFVRVKKHFFAFKHFESNKKLEESCIGWHLFDLVREFNRMEIQLMPHTQSPINDYWSDFKILDNKDGKICPTYPEKIIVPSRIPYDSLVRCSKFRSRSRMPALTFIYHYDNQNYSGLYRSSQSKVGVSNSRSPDDQLMLRYIGNPQYDPKQNEYKKQINCVIYDARNKMAAFGNKVAGKGYQSEEFYPNCKVQFLNIPNIHAVRQSYAKALKAAQGEDSKFYSTLAESEWYDFGASQVARTLTHGQNVLVHCSDGWDRTSQLCSLAGIYLDPYYRTLVGFQVLIQKDWMRFGHQFAVRMGQGVNNPTGEQKSPVFLQFLDCVTQLLYQYPTDFEFNYRYLQDLAQFAQTNLYGNFLCNCQIQMKNYSIQTKTISMWSYFIKNRENYLNPFYLSSHPRLHPSSAQKHFRFWKQHFLLYVDGFQDIYDIYSCKFTQDNLQIMYKHVKQGNNLLQQKIVETKKQLDETNRLITSLEESQSQKKEQGQ